MLYLKTLNEREFRNGLAEVIKTAMIENTCLLQKSNTVDPIVHSDSLFDLLQEHAAHVNALIRDRNWNNEDLQLLLNIIKKSIRVKVILNY